MSAALRAELAAARAQLEERAQAGAKLEAEVEEMQRTVEMERAAAASSNAVMSDMLTKASESLRAEHAAEMAEALAAAREASSAKVVALPTSPLTHLSPRDVPHRARRSDACKATCTAPGVRSHQHWPSCGQPPAFVAAARMHSLTRRLAITCLRCSRRSVR